MREKELRLALVCYGGISLAVYMHGVTKEIWHLARASRDAQDDETPAPDVSQTIYREIIDLIEERSGAALRILPDIIAGASAGGINGIFLAHALATGYSLEALTKLWLENADVDNLIDPDARPMSKMTKFWATPIAWMVLKRPGNVVSQTVSSGARTEVRSKLSRFVRARWLHRHAARCLFGNGSGSQRAATDPAGTAD
jgi:patatin-related protein